MRHEPPPTAAQTEQFLSALAEWSGRPLDEFPTDAPPCASVGAFDEDAVLARVFIELAHVAPYHDQSRRLAILTAAITTHQRRYDLMLNAARGIGPSDPANSLARRPFVETKPYKKLIDTLHVWNGALFDQMLGVAA